MRVAQVFVISLACMVEGELPSVLVCIAGQSERFGTTLIYTARHLLDPLQADFVVVADPGELDTASVQEQNLRNRVLAHLPSHEGRLMAVHTPVRISVQEMSSKIEERVGASWKDYKIFFDKNETARHLWNFWLKDLCTRQLSDIQDKLQKQYEWFIYVRSDLLFLAHHPPLSVLEPGYFWAFDNQEWLGLNERYYAVHRSTFPAIIGLWDKVVSQRMLSLLRAEGHLLDRETNSEKIVYLLVIKEAALPVGRIAPLAFRSCTGKSTLRPGVGCQGILRNKVEFLDAFGVAERIREGWAYTRSSRWHGTPSYVARYGSPFHCFFGNRTREKCCALEETHAGAWSDETCWGESSALQLPQGMHVMNYMAFSYDACCKPDLLVSIAPPLNGAALDPCWPVDMSSAGVQLSCISVDFDRARLNLPPTDSKWANVTGTSALSNHDVWSALAQGYSEQVQSASLHLTELGLGDLPMANHATAQAALEQGKESVAEEQWQLVREGLESTHGPKHRDVGMLLWNIGLCYLREWEKYYEIREGERYYEKALAKIKESLEILRGLRDVMYDHVCRDGFANVIEAFASFAQGRGDSASAEYLSEVLLQCTDAA